MNTETIEKRTLYGWRYDSLHVVVCDKKKPAVGCGYYYLVRTNSSNAHTAFRHQHELKRWMKDRGLKVGKRCWLGNSFRIAGSYFDGCEMMNTRDFFNTYGHLRPIRVLSNGDYVIGFTDDKGNVYHQNPNTDRIKLEHSSVAQSLADKDTKWRDKQFVEFAKSIVNSFKNAIGKDATDLL